MRWNALRRLTSIGVIAALPLWPLAAAGAPARVEEHGSIVSDAGVPSLQAVGRTAAAIVRLAFQNRAATPAKGGAKAGAVLVAAVSIVGAGAGAPMRHEARPRALEILAATSGPRPPPLSTPA
jgi:hypothetical protein